MQPLRSTILLTASLAALSAATAPGETVYTITVAPGSDKSDWYISRDADTIAILDTTPEGDNRFRAGSGSVVNSKPHGRTLWLGRPETNTETLFQAKSAPIQLGGTSWVKCTGEFKVEVGSGDTKSEAVAQKWNSQLKEKPGHIIIVHQYVGPAAQTTARESIDAVIKAQGNWYFNSYSEGGGRYKVTVGRGGDVASYAGIGAFLARKDITPASVITVDDLGHGAHANVGPFLSGLPAGEDDDGNPLPDTRMSVQFTGISDMLSGNANAHISAAATDHSVGDNIVPAEVAAGVGGVLNDNNGNPYVAVPAYTAQYQNYLKTDETVKVDLLHCFTAEHGQKTVTMMATPDTPVTSAYPSVRDAFDTALPDNVTVVGYNGMIHYPGTSAPSGNAVSN